MDSDSESELISLITQLLSLEVTAESESDWDSDLDSDSHSVSEFESRIIPLIIQIISLVNSMALDWQPKPESKVMSLVTQTISIFNSMDLNSQPEPLSDLISLIISQNISLDNNRYWDYDSEFISLLDQTVELEPVPKLMSLIRQILSLVVSMNSKWVNLISLCPQEQVKNGYIEGNFQVDEEVEERGNNKWKCLPSNWLKFSLSGEEYTHFLCKGCNGKNHKEYEEAPVEIKQPLHLKHPLEVVLLKEGCASRECYCCDEDLIEVFYYCPACDFSMNIACVEKPPELYMDSKSESKLISLITQLMSIEVTMDSDLDSDADLVSKNISLILQTISLVRSIDLDSQLKPESNLMSLVTQAISLFNFMDLDYQPKPLSDLISLISHKLSHGNSKDSDFDSEFWSLFDESIKLEPEPELLSLIHQVLSLVVSMNTKWVNLICVSPQVKVYLSEAKFHVDEEVKEQTSSDKWECFPINWKKFSSTGEEYTHFFCQNCCGKNHDEYEKAPVEIKHPLHPKHSLQLVLLNNEEETRKCYCCDEGLTGVIYYCSACDFAMNIACVVKPPVLSIDHPKWHEHTLAHFPRDAPITCNLCALTDLKSSHIYMCPPCDFVVHKSCLKLPRVIRISRHPHRISFTFSFDQGDWSCGVCRKKIHNDYGGYSCIKKGCSYAAHSKCATQSNVWDGIDLDGVPEELEEEVDPPFVRISDGIIQHFSHQHHHLRLDEDKGRVFNENKQCQICITPIYFGNFYSCMQCKFILHETCANLPRRIYTPIHPHMLSLVGSNNKESYRCSACPDRCTAGLYYKCRNGECYFRLHVQCATVSEPLVHGSHIHPLFLTSKPGEQRECSVCQDSRFHFTNETFNCIESECDFAMCFGCATIPQKVRYKHDKHTLTLSYGDQETSTMINWCEACEGVIKPKERFYKCDEYCCVTLHIECLIGEDLYMKPDSSYSDCDRMVNVMPNNQHMSRPFCFECKKRCPYKIVFEFSGLVFCTVICLIPVLIGSTETSIA